VGCAAPEQYTTNGVLDERTDIFSIGAVLNYLYTGKFPVLPYQTDQSMDSGLLAVISQCVCKEKENRFQTAQELMEQLCLLKDTGTDAKKRLETSSLTIALSGSKSGAGTTHIGIGLSVYLRNQGYPNLLEEKLDSFMGTGLSEFTKAKRDSYGLLHYRNLIIKPYYGPGVKLKDPPFGVRLLDWGENLCQAVGMAPDALILVCDASIWSSSRACDAVEAVMKSKIPYAVIFNHSSAGAKLFLPKGVKPSFLFRAPFFSDPFTVRDETEAFYQALINVILTGNRKKSIKKRFLNWVRSMTRKCRSR
jgi:serine/threonine-protein kinase